MTTTEPTKPKPPLWAYRPLRPEDLAEFAYLQEPLLPRLTQAEEDELSRLVREEDGEEDEGGNNWPSS